MGWKFFLLIFSVSVLCLSCKKDDKRYIPEIITKNKDTDSTIYISDDIKINDNIKPRDSIFSYNAYEEFIKKMVESNKFIFVPHNEFNSTFSKNKIIISLRHDIDYDIESAVRFARRENKYGIRSTYFFLHSAEYYAELKKGSVIRNPDVLLYMKKIQDEYRHEIGFHNDLVTLQVLYNINSESFLKDELSWLRENGIYIYGSAYHGTASCYRYKYLNAYFWKKYPKSESFPSYDSVNVNGRYFKIEKFRSSDFNLSYEAGFLSNNHFFSDVFFMNNKRWHFGMINWNLFKPGDRIVILTHSALWD